MEAVKYRVAIRSKLCEEKASAKPVHCGSGARSSGEGDEGGRNGQEIVDRAVEDDGAWRSHPSRSIQRRSDEQVPAIKGVLDLDPVDGWGSSIRHPAPEVRQKRQHQLRFDGGSANSFEHPVLRAV